MKLEPKLDLAKQYDEYVNNKNQIPRQETEEQIVYTQKPKENKKNIIYTDNNGDFRIKIAIGDTLIFTKNNFIRYEISFTSEKNGFRVLLESGYQKKINAWVGGACLIKKRTFFGRVFHSVGNWFK